MDAEAFPLQSEVYPLLSEKGAYDQDSVYTKSDVKDVIEYARMRGIRVLPEFDMPGHSYSWSKGYPEIFSNCPRTKRQNAYAITLDPFQNETTTFIRNLLEEWFSVFHDKVSYQSSFFFAAFLGT
jgi:hexosaminidase